MFCVARGKDMELDPLPASLMMGLLQGDVYEQAKAGGEWGWGLW